MSLNPKEKCAVCSAYLFSDDDIVYCPVCGAPHHRDCYNSIGHCALEDLHGTENQYKKPAPENFEPQANTNNKNTVKCGMCGESYDPALNNCPKCNAPNFGKMGGRFVSFDFLGGVPAETDLGEGVTANEAKRFVATNTQRYIPKFASNKKASWNWLAFLFPCGWALSRKMYLQGAIIGALQMALTFLTFPYQKAMSRFQISETEGTVQYMRLLLQKMQENIDTIGKWVIIAAALVSVLSILVNVLVGIFGDRMYKKHVISTVRDIKTSGGDIDEKFAKKGAVNLWLGLLGIMAVDYIPQIIYTFI